MPHPPSGYSWPAREAGPLMRGLRHAEGGFGDTGDGQRLRAWLAQAAALSVPPALFCPAVPPARGVHIAACAFSCALSPPRVHCPLLACPLKSTFPSLSLAMPRCAGVPPPHSTPCTWVGPTHLPHCLLSPHLLHVSSLCPLQDIGGSRKQRPFLASFVPWKNLSWVYPTITRNSCGFTKPLVWF